MLKLISLSTQQTFTYVLSPTYVVVVSGSPIVLPTTYPTQFFTRCIQHYQGENMMMSTTVHPQLSPKRLIGFFQWVMCSWLLVHSGQYRTCHCATQLQGWSVSQVGWLVHWTIDPLVMLLSLLSCCQTRGCVQQHVERELSPPWFMICS